MIEPGSMTWAAVGGGIIGLAAVLMLALNGRILGVSGIAAGILSPATSERANRVLFVLGMVSGGLLVGALLPQALPGALTSKPLLLIGAGLCVGFGTRLGGGCTSGHGVCGMSRLSPRSFTATAVFIAVAMVTVWVTRHVMGGIS